jgi:hypothetical protein
MCDAITNRNIFHESLVYTVNSQYNPIHKRSCGLDFEFSNLSELQ